MPQLIKQGQLIQDDWLRLERLEDKESLPDGKLLVPVSVWQVRHEELADRKQLGVWLDSSEEPACISNDLHHFELVAINFPAFADGRGYSYARLLRERYNYPGELRAIGDVLIDQLYYLKRCGFDAFALRSDQNMQLALASLATFSESYQAATDQPIPLFRRRQ
jgi:uncharacterized protein (DUF934 family)